MYIYIETDTLLQVKDLKDASDDYVNDATIVASLYYLKTLLAAAGSIVDLGGEPNKITIPVPLGHGLITADVIRLIGSSNYNVEYTLTDSADQTITIASAYTAEILLGSEVIYKGLKNAINLSVTSQDSVGNYQGTLPGATVALTFNSLYWLMYHISSPAILIRKKVKAIYYEGE